MNKSLSRSLGLGLVLAAMVAAGYWLMFTQFMVYDDEGYVLWSLHNYFAAGGLYTKVYSQYGPFFYAFYDALHRLVRLPFDNETGRLLTLFYWCGTAGLCGWFVWRQTRQAVAAAAAMVLTFGALLVMINEPGHPGGLLAFMAALGAVGGAMALERGRTGWFALLTGGLAAAMVLTKINVGAFFLIAAGSWLAINVASPRLGRAALWLAALGTLLVPLTLVHSLWPETWVAEFCLSFCCAALALLLLLKQQQQALFGPRPWLVFVGTGLGLGLLVLGLVHLRGTSLAMLWHGVAIAPLRQPLVYAYPIKWSAFAPWLAMGMFSLALLAQGRSWSGRAPWLASLRLIAVVCFLLQIPHCLNGTLTSFCFRYGPIFAWVMTVPLTAETPSPAGRARTWLAWVFIWQTLQVYPVAGSQMGWGSFLWVPLAVIGWYEATAYWAGRMRKIGRITTVVAAGVLLVGSLDLLAVTGYVGQYRYFVGQPLGLRGASSLRVADNLTSTYRILDRNIRRYGDELFSYPGMFSFNIWTERPTPTLANVTHWFSLLNDDEQQEIIDQLEHDARPVLVVQSYLINYIVAQGFPPRGLLQRYLVQNFAPAFRIESFEFWVRRGRTVAPVGTARIIPATSHEPTAIELITDATAPAARVEVRRLYYPYAVIARINVCPEQPWAITALHPDNTAAGPALTVTTPTAAGPLSRIIIPFTPDKMMPPLDQLELVLVGTMGQPLDTLRFTH